MMQRGFPKIAITLSLSSFIRIDLVDVNSQGRQKSKQGTAEEPIRSSYIGEVSPTCQGKHRRKAYIVKKALVLDLNAIPVIEAT